MSYPELAEMMGCSGFNENEKFSLLQPFSAKLKRPQAYLSSPWEYICVDWPRKKLGNKRSSREMGAGA